MRKFKNPSFTSLQFLLSFFLLTFLLCKFAVQSGGLYKKFPMTGMVAFFCDPSRAIRFSRLTSAMEYARAHTGLHEPLRPYLKRRRKGRRGHGRKGLLDKSTCC